MPRYVEKSPENLCPLSFRVNEDSPFRSVRNKTVDRSYLSEQWVNYVAAEESGTVVLPGIQFPKDKDVVTMHYYEQLSRATEYLPNPVVKIVTEGITDDARKSIKNREEKEKQKLECGNCKYEKSKPCCLFLHSPNPSEVMVGIKKIRRRRPKLKLFDRNTQSTKAPSRLSAVEAVCNHNVQVTTAIQHLCMFGQIDEVSRCGSSGLKVVYRYIFDACYAVMYAERAIVTCRWWNERLENQHFTLEPEEEQVVQEKDKKGEEEKDEKEKELKFADK